MTTLATAQHLYGAARDLMDAQPTGEVARLADGLPPTLEGEDLPPRPVPVERLRQTLPAGAMAKTQRLVDAFAAARDLTWFQSYTEADFGAAFLRNYGWVELLGPYGPARSATHRCGILMFGPATHYPAHAHGPEEIYITLAGQIDWHLEDAAPRRISPGNVIHHAPWQRHGFTTCETPVALFALWRGADLATKSEIL